MDDFLKESRPLIERIQRQLENAVPPTLPPYLKEPVMYFLETPGKKVRPLLTLHAAQVVGGNINDALPAAAAVELFHDFTLVHDDIMDEDALRRGRPTIHTRWDESTAILVGDAFLGLAYQELLKSPPDTIPRVTRVFSDALVKVCEGQALDKQFENQPNVSLEEYLDMITKKTAWLLQVACQLGGIVGGGTADQIEWLRQFGYYLGVGFQIQDDLLDLIASPEKLGKTVGSDFKMHKKTYFAIRYQEEIERSPDLRQRYPAHFEAFTSPEAFRQALEELGLIEETRQVAREYLNKSLHALNQVAASGTASPLRKLVEFLAAREY